MKQQLNADELNAISRRARRFYRWRAGMRKREKRSAWRRLRREGKREARNIDP